MRFWKAPGTQEPSGRTLPRASDDAPTVISWGARARFSPTVERPWPRTPATRMEQTFSNFVVGPSNQFAHAASLAVANLPAQAYNPLFLYGGSGLGKTHLLVAIAHHLTHRDASRRVRYRTAERFVHELALAARDNHMTAFRNRYRQLDVLLMDDVHVLTGKERSQEEFFHTFNALYEGGKQVVVSSNRLPEALTPLHERLCSRLGAGLTASLQPPDLDTRVAILNHKARERGLPLTAEVAMLLAARLSTGVRQLEEGLTRIGAYASLHGQAITPELAATVLQQMLDECQETLSVQRIQQAVAAHFGLRPGVLTSNNRTRAITFPRQVAMFLCREMLDISLPEIGRLFGGKDHTTVLHACTKIARQARSDEQTAHLLWQLRQTLGE